MVGIEEHDVGGDSDCDGEHDEYRNENPLYFSLVGLKDFKVVAMMVIMMVMVSMMNMLGTVHVVDRPTQLFFIWISICCKYTNLKDTAGQSATVHVQCTSQNEAPLHI